MWVEVVVTYFMVLSWQRLKQDISQRWGRHVNTALTGLKCRISSIRLIRREEGVENICMVFVLSL